MTLVRFRYLHEQGIFNDRGALARAIDHYGFPKPMALGDNTLAWDLEKEVEPWLASRPRRTPKCSENLDVPNPRTPRTRPPATVEDVQVGEEISPPSRLEIECKEEIAAPSP